MSTASDTTETKTNPKLMLHWTRIVPAVDSVTGTAPMARSSHGVSILQNPRRIFVYGGEHEARTPIAADQAAWEVNLDDAQPTWRNIDCSNGPSPRIAHAQAVDTVTNTVYIFGGRAGILMNEMALNDLWCYNGDTGIWSEITAANANSDRVPCARSFHRMVCIDQTLYVFGGCGKEGRLNDLHTFDLRSKTWEALPGSSLKGRGGPNLMPLHGGQKLGVIAGFAGQETNDGQVFDIDSQSWSESLMAAELQDMRPRSVCVCGSFPSMLVSIVFGGEVNPSDRGHEGAGGFANDVCILDESTGAFIETVKKTADNWPEERGWADAVAVDTGNRRGEFYLFGGLSGDDKSPRRLDDLWKLEIAIES